MSYFNNYKILLPLFEQYLANFYKAVHDIDFCLEIVQRYENKENLSEDEQKVYDMCTMVTALENVIQCIKFDDQEEFDRIEPVLFDLVKRLKETIVLVQ